MDESYLFKIKYQFTEYVLGFLAKGAIFMSSVTVKTIHQPTLGQFNGARNATLHSASTFRLCLDSFPMILILLVVVSQEFRR